MHLAKWLIEHAMDNELLTRLKIAEDNLHLLHKFSIDDVNLMMKANLTNILCWKHIFGLFANASGLQCN